MAPLVWCVPDTCAYMWVIILYSPLIHKNSFSAKQNMSRLKGSCIQALCVLLNFISAPVNCTEQLSPITLSARALRQSWYHAVVTLVKAVCVPHSAATIWCHDHDVCLWGHMLTDISRQIAFGCGAHRLQTDYRSCLELKQYRFWHEYGLCVLGSLLWKEMHLKCTLLPCVSDIPDSESSDSSV